MKPDLLCLASSSPYRKQQLKQLGLPFECRSPSVDETPLPDEDAEKIAHRLSIAKAEEIAAQIDKGIVIGSDQCASCDGQLLHKPLTVAKAIEQLQWCTGKTATFYTGLCVIDTISETRRTAMVPTRATFRALSNEKIQCYVKREPALNCAGGFKMEGLGISLFASIHSEDPSALIGLPMIALVSLLQSLGIEIL